MGHTDRNRSIRRLGPALLGLALALGPALGAAESAIEQGKKLSFDQNKGNCLACHAMGDGESPGDIGPPLVAMKARYPDKNALRTQIWDSTVTNPYTIMPPFGKFKILTEEEIDKVVDYVHGL